MLAGDHPKILLDAIKSRWNDAGLPSDNLLALGHVSDRDLVHLYRHARLLVQPSLMEGFGLTALEAMMCGTPVIGSSQGALPEIIQDPELMFDAKDPQNIADRMVRILRDPTFASQVSDWGLQKAQQFSWTKSAEIAAKALPKQRVAVKTKIRLRATRTCATEHSQPWASAKCSPVFRRDIGACGTTADLARTAFDRRDFDCSYGGSGIQRVTKQTTRNLALLDLQRNASSTVTAMKVSSGSTSMVMVVSQQSIGAKVEKFI